MKESKLARELAGVKPAIRKAVEAQRKELIALSTRIHSHPELGFKEVQAAGWLSDYLEGKGFSLERGYGGMATAFRASYGKGKPTIALLAEYDALPELGHACGHNIIAVSAVGAGVAAKLAVDNWGGRVVVIGTPAEELYGGKIFLVKGGAFKDVDAALIVHPGSRNSAFTQALACQALEVEFFGKAAHAAARPEAGINALEAMILSFQGINSLRQHIREGARIHGIITDGGKAANVVPDHSAGNFLVRARDEKYLEKLQAKVLNCFQAAALATGARLKYRWGEVCYAALRTNLALADAFARNMETLGRNMEPFDLARGFGSTDMGNVSQVVPGIHPSIAIVSGRVSTHSLEFASAAISPKGHRGLLDAAKALAMTVADLLAQPELLSRIKEEFAQSYA